MDNLTAFLSAATLVFSFVAAYAISYIHRKYQYNSEGWLAMTAAAWLLVLHRLVALLYDSEALSITESEFRLASVAVFFLVSICFLLAAWRIKEKGDEYAMVHKKAMDQVEYFERFEAKEKARKRSRSRL